VRIGSRFIDWGIVEWILLAQDRYWWRSVACSCEYGTELSSFGATELVG
jgi:hypothetical protein